MIVIFCNTKSASSLETFAITNADFIADASLETELMKPWLLLTLRSIILFLLPVPLKTELLKPEPLFSVDTFANNSGTVAGASQLKNTGAVIWP